MHKKILLVEQSDATRGVAETLLRQNGFDVVGVSAAERAVEVLKFGRPDLIVAGSDLMLSGKAFYQLLMERDDSNQLNLVVLHDMNSPALTIPSEMVIARPFDPRKFLETVQSFTAGTKGPATPAASKTGEGANTLGDTELDDEFLDAALGLEGIEVTDSEIMNRTGSLLIKKPTNDEMVGMSEVGEGSDLTDSGRVEAIMISDDQTDIRQGKKSEPAPVSGTGKIDILNDQFGLTNPKEMEIDAPDGDHDYDWFVGEMQKNDTIDAADDTDQGADEKLTFSDAAQFVDPITKPAGVSPPKKSNSDSGGVEKFIDEFKKEVEKFQADELDSVTLQPDVKAEKSWEDSLETTSTEQVALFTKEFAAVLAEKVAEMIASKIDADKLLRLIKTELMKKRES